MTPIGIGAWSWGDRSGYWGYGQGYQKDDNFEAFKGMIDAGIGLIDTAEVCVLSACQYTPHRYWRQYGRRKKHRVCSPGPLYSPGGPILTKALLAATTVLDAPGCQISEVVPGWTDC